MKLSSLWCLFKRQTRKLQDRAARRPYIKRGLLGMILLLSCVMLTLLVLSPTRDNLIRQIGLQLAEQSDMLSYLYTDPADDVAAAKELQELPIPAQTHLWVARPNGQTILPAEYAPTSLKSTTPHTQIMALLGDKNHIRLRLSDGAEIIAGGKLLPSGSWLILAREESEVPTLTYEQHMRLIRLGLFGTLLGLFSLHLHLANVNRPMQNLMTALRETQSTGHIAEFPDLSDNTQIGKLSETLRETMATLHDRIETNAQFAADVAHELKNPLASLQSAAQTLSRVKDPEKQARLISIIQQDVQRMDRLLSDIANASRLDSDLVKSMAETFDLRDVLSPALYYYEAECAKKGVELVSTLPATPVQLNGLPERLGQVVVNLLDNALSFAPEGSKLLVSLYRVESRTLLVVEDEGPGIPDDDLQKIFSRFYSMRPGLAFGEHSGLGLAITKQIVEAHDGVIWAENRTPTGARFVVGLPL